MSQIVQGTIGGNDWTYKGGDPVVKIEGYIFSDNIPIVFLTDLCFMNNDWGLVNYQDYDISVVNRIETSRRSFTGYKVALYKTTPKTGLSNYNIYGNRNGDIDSISMHTLRYDRYSTTPEGFYEYLNSGVSNFNVGLDTGTPDIDYRATHFHTSIPIFENYANMLSWLGSDSVDFEAYGGYSVYEPEPEPERSDNVNFPDFYNGEINDGLLGGAIIDGTNLSKLSKIMSGGRLDLALKSEIGTGIISYRTLCVPQVTEPFYGNETVIIDANNFFGEALGTLDKYKVSGKPLTRQFLNFNFGSFKIDSFYNSFLDYSPYTKLSIYLPFCGMQELDPSLIVNSNCTLECVIDFLSGSLLYRLKVDDAGVQKDIYTWTGTCLMERPISYTDYGSTTGRLTSGILATIGGIAAVVATGGAAAPAVAPAIAGGGIAAAGGVASATSALNSTPSKTVGQIGGNSGYNAINYPYVIIERTEPQEPSNYGKVTGRPSMNYETFSNLVGYTEVYEVHLSNMSNATQDEISEIEELLRSGVEF